MSTLTLLGNDIYDYIYNSDDDLVIERNGGVWNVARYLRIPYQQHITEQSISKIFLGSAGVPRINQISWAESDDMGEIEWHPDTTWVHISYLDAVSVDLTPVLDKKISADLIGRRDPTPEQLASIDFLFCETDDLIKLTLEDLRHSVRGSVIIRDKMEIVIADRIEMRTYPNTYIEVSNTVAAGDVFVAEFLNQVVPIGYLPGSKEAEVIQACVDASLNFLSAQNMEMLYEI